jgi:hypothetical protein
VCFLKCYTAFEFKNLNLFFLLDIELFEHNFFSPLFVRFLFKFILYILYKLYACVEYINSIYIIYSTSNSCFDLITTIIDDKHSQINKKKFRFLIRKKTTTVLVYFFLHVPNKIEKEINILANIYSGVFIYPIMRDVM